MILCIACEREYQEPGEFFKPAIINGAAVVWDGDQLFNLNEILRQNLSEDDWVERREVKYWYEGVYFSVNVESERYQWLLAPEGPPPEKSEISTDKTDELGE